MSFAHNGEVEIYYETFGDPGDPALLLINGLGSQCINYRDAWCEMFAAERFFVIRFDNRDVGLSTKFTGFRPDLAGVLASVAAGNPANVPYTMADMAKDAVAVLDALGIEKAHIAGASMGGMIAQTLAIDHADRLLSMTSIMSSTGDTDVGLPSAEARQLIMAPAPVDRQAYIARHLQSMRIWGSPACNDEARLTENAAAAFDRCFCPDGQARQMAAIIASGSRTEALGHVRVRTLVLHGDADKLVNPSGGRRTADAIDGAQYVLIEGMGHDYPPQHWGRVVQLVTDHARTAAQAPA